MTEPFASAQERLGQTLSGKYELEQLIGVGGTAVVYRARHKNNGHRVAVKMLHDHLARSGDVRRRFMREGYLANMLEHPGTVRVLDDDETEHGTAYLVLELVDGETLEDRRVRLGGTLPVDEVLGYADQLLAVLEVAHAQSIVHRDIKPSNLVITTEGQLKVLDFGIARILDDVTSATVTKTGQMIGTPAFMPPEQALSKPREIDAQSDLWAVAATMFTLLSGELVHDAESSAEHLVKAATTHARSVAQVLPGVPRRVEALIAKGLAFFKRDRWLCATDMRHELWSVRLDPGEPVGTQSRPPPKRNPLSDAPTVVGRRSDKPAEPDTTRALVADTGQSEPPERQARRPWIVGAAAAALAVVLAGGVLAMSRMAQVQGPPPMTASPAVVAPVTSTTAPAPSAPAMTTSTAAPEPVPSVVALGSAPTAKPVVPNPRPTARLPSGGHGSAPASSSAVVPVVAPPTTAAAQKPQPAPSVDIYRPF